MPEAPFEAEKFLQRTAQVVDQKRTTVIAVSEGICDKNGEYVLSGLADSIAVLVLEHIFVITITTESLAAVRIMYLVWSKAILILCTLTVKVLKQNVFRKLMHLKVYMMVIIPISIFTMYLIKSRISLWRINTFSEVFVNS